MWCFQGTYRHFGEKCKEEVLELDNDQTGKLDKDRPQRRKSERSREDHNSDGKREVSNSWKDDFTDVRLEEGIYRDIKKENRAGEGRQKNNRPKESRDKDERGKEYWLKNQGDTDDEENIKVETGMKQEYRNRYREDKATDDKFKRRKDQHVKEDRSRLKEKTRLEAAADKERNEKYREDGFAIVKNKHEKKKGETEQSSSGKNREDSRTDHIVDSKGKYEKKIMEREKDYNARPAKSHTDKVRLEQQQDGRDMDMKENNDKKRENYGRNSRHKENPSKDEKFNVMNDQMMSERDRKEQTKDDVDRYSKPKGDCKERRWGNAPEEEWIKDGKDSIDVQKHSREVDERQRHVVTDGKHKTERGKSDRRYSNKNKEERQEDMLTLDKVGSVKETIREVSVADKDDKHINVGRDHYEQISKQCKELDGQPELKASHEAEERDNKKHGTIRGDRSYLKSSKSSFQDQDKMLLVTSLKDTNSSDYKSKRNRGLDVFGSAIVDRDHAR